MTAHEIAIGRLLSENAELRRRAEQSEALARELQAQRDQAEADATALKEALEHVQNILDRGQEIGADDVPIYALTDIVNPVLIEHPSAALLAELEAARALRAACQPLGSMARLSEACAVYDAVVKGRKIA